MAVSAADIHEGMKVRSNTGELLGAVYALGDRQFELERGWFRIHDYLVRLRDVDELLDGELFLRGGRELLHEDVDEENVPVESTADEGMPAEAEAPQE